MLRSNCATRPFYFCPHAANLSELSNEVCSGFLVEVVPEILTIKVLRVLLVKWPDMSKPTFFGQYLFVCIIKSTHQVDVPGNKTWDLRAKTVQWQAILDLGPRQK